MSDEEGDEADECVQRVVASGPGERVVGTVGGAIQSPVAHIHTHFGADAEEASDEVVCLQDALRVHLSHKCGECFRAVLATVLRVVHGHPFPQQLISLLLQPRWVVELPGLRDARVHHPDGSSGLSVDHTVVHTCPNHLDQPTQLFLGTAGSLSDPDQHLYRAVKVSLERT